ncbi:aldo/keto reductase [Hahella sp. CCB-MM4]|uniref:aldo/keto reductase n=1 Tax=Hahella sp. (strain CCB-MM4) TaxID=1926491 RepID=UPI000B9B4061|nr:aldo/keto reductase [Hahella sp. CCB-MM4]OZG74504.1 aldo/keto reductase [Hahella sp. CCB-MM4]
MKTRKLGTSGLEVSAIGLGCMGMSDFYGHHDDKASSDTLLRALDIGINFWDTADMYGPHTNELLLGKVLKESGRRDEVVLATKFGIQRDSDGQFLGVCGRPEYVRQCCEDSLKRLGVDHIDLYYQHRMDSTVPIEDTVGAMAELVREGKIGHIGLSEANATLLQRANAVHPITALQSEYSLWTRELEDSILPACRELGISLVAYSPLGRGFLTGAYKNRDSFDENDWRLTNPRFSEENFQANLALVEQVNKLAADKGCTSAQLALAWLLHQQADLVPIPGTRKISRLEENAGAVEITLSEEELGQITAGIPKDMVQGSRYPEMAMQLLRQ